MTASPDELRKVSEEASEKASEEALEKASKNASERAERSGPPGARRGPTPAAAGAADAELAEPPGRALRVRVRREGSVSVPLPAYQTAGSAGLDLCAALEAPVALEPLERRLIPTGLALELPPGFEAQVRPRSGLALRHGLTVLNSPGTIDADYRGQLQVLLINFGAQPVEIRPLERIAQLVVAPVVRVELAWSDAALSRTARGAGGYGSTGG